MNRNNKQDKSIWQNIEMLGEGEKKPLKLPRNEYFTFIAYYSSLLKFSKNDYC